MNGDNENINNNGEPAETEQSGALDRRAGNRRSEASESEAVERRLRLDRRKDSDEPLAACRASMLNRFLARVIDLLIFGALCSVLYPVGLLAGFTYILIADGLWNGRSVGKRIIGLHTVQVNGRWVADFKHSVLRNLSVAFVLLLAVIPIIGWLLLITVGILVVAVEFYLAWTDSGGQRAGDILAGTLVVNECGPGVRIRFDGPGMTIETSGESPQNGDDIPEKPEDACK